MAIGPKPVWFPNPLESEKTHIGQMMKKYGFTTYLDFHRWSYKNYPEFWQAVVESLNIQFDVAYSNIVDLSLGPKQPKWFPNAKMNIVNSCFHFGSSDKEKKQHLTAIIQGDALGNIKKYSYFDLENTTNKIAFILSQQFKKECRIAIIMPMDFMTVALYLACIKVGIVVVSIAESFSAEEIALRLQITKAEAIFTIHQFYRDNKIFHLYDKILASGFGQIYLLSDIMQEIDKLIHNTIDAPFSFPAVSVSPEEMMHILFSSGTTNIPKAIPWDHTTPIKCASDAYFHHNLKRGQRFCWPSGLGWMMGPWLIFATLLNRATMVLYQDSPMLAPFGQFIEATQTQILGVIPTFVRAWKNTQCMEKYHWQNIQLFTSTGECSNPEDMLYLMSLPKRHDQLNNVNKNSKDNPQYVPIMEYCGGTEIGGAYITGSLVQAQAPATFTTPTLGLNFVLLNDKGNINNTQGEVAIIPPSIGLSTTLLNHDHEAVYYKNMPIYDSYILRRHGDHFIHYTNGFYKSLGRIDDTMNLGGIKIAAAEIESVLNSIPEVYETAAVALSPQNGGPSELIIYAVLKERDNSSEIELQMTFQNTLKEHLNPLFKIHKVVIVDSLLRTASNKIIRKTKNI